MTLREALLNIHRDPHWWQKVGIGGAPALTGVGIPWSVGTVTVSLDNALKGFSYPLPPWNDWGTRYIIGVFTQLLDLVFFGFPLLIMALFACCALAISTMSSNPAVTDWVVLITTGIIVALELMLFTLNIRPIGRLIFLTEGRVEDAMSMRPLHEALGPGTHNMYFRARLQSLPIYLPILLWFILQSSFPGLWIVGLLILWLSLSTLFYAHLVVVQLYATANKS